MWFWLFHEDSQELVQLLKTYSQGFENNDVKHECLTSTGISVVKHESWSWRDSQKQSEKLPKFTGRLAGSKKKAFFINTPSHTAIPQAQIEQGVRARERLREGEWEQRFDKEGESLISVLHTLLDDQSRKCCFNSKNHISSPVHKLIIANYAAGQRGREEEEKERQRRHTEKDPQIQLVY